MIQKLLLCFSVLGFTLGAASEGFGQWVQTNGPSGGYIRAFAQSGTTLFAAVDKATNGGFGVFRSTDNGKSWSAKNNGLTDLEVWALAVSGTNLFCGTQSGGLFRSTDSGATWTASNNGLSNMSVHALEVNGSYVFAGTPGGIFLSTNSGANWESVASGNVICLKRAGTNLFAGTYGHGILISSNNGASWTEDTTGLTNNKVYALAVSGNNILAGTSGGGVFVSTNNGSDWAPDTVGLVGSGLQGGLYDYSLAMIGNDYFVGTQEGGVFRSTNNGASWAAVNSGLTNTFGTALLASGNNLLAGTINGIFLSTNNGTTWTYASNGLPVNTPVQAFTTIGQDAPMLFAGEGSNFRGNYLGGFFLSNDNGNNWQASNGLPANSDITALTVSGANSSLPVIFAGTAGYLSGPGLIFRSSDSGATWSRATNGLSTWLAVSALESIGGAGTSPPIVFAGTTGATGGGSVLRSTDDGTTWKSANSGLASVAVTSFAVIGSNSSSPIVFAGTFGNGVFRSSDSGSTWVAGGSAGDMNVQALAIIGDNASSPILFASAYTGVYLSRDSGRNWIDAGLDTDRIQALAVSGANVFAGAYGGTVFLSADSGTTWKPVGLSNIEIQALAVAGSNLYAGTYGEGVWRRPLSDFGISDVSPADSIASALVSYPNPLAQSATIRFTSTDGGMALISIVNLLGTPVAQLFDGELQAGQHSFTWDASNVPLGSYWCVVRMGSRTERIALSVQR
ncbi:MAG: regulator [Candidatus Kapaibacterium sp.]